MEINNLSIADLKAALDFDVSDLKEMEQLAANKNISPNEIPAYVGVKKEENDLYHRLLNITRNLK